MCNRFRNTSFARENSISSIQEQGTLYDLIFKARISNDFQTDLCETSYEQPRPFFSQKAEGVFVCLWVKHSMTKQENWKQNNLSAKFN